MLLLGIIRKGAAFSVFKLSSGLLSVKEVAIISGILRQIPSSGSVRLENSLCTVPEQTHLPAVV